MLKTGPTIGGGGTSFFYAPHVVRVPHADMSKRVNDTEEVKDIYRCFWYTVSSCVRVMDCRRQLTTSVDEIDGCVEYSG